MQVPTCWGGQEYHLGCWNGVQGQTEGGPQGKGVHVWLRMCAHRWREGWAMRVRLGMCVSVQVRSAGMLLWGWASTHGGKRGAGGGRTGGGARRSRQSLWETCVPGDEPSPAAEGSGRAGAGVAHRRMAGGREKGEG